MLRFSLVTLLGLAATAAELESMGELQFVGQVPGAEDLSAAAFIGGQLAVASDESAEVTLLEPLSSGQSYRVSGHITLGNDPTAELDLEALAAVGDTLYVLGSHSAKRKNVNDGHSYKENRKRLRKIEHDADRDVLGRVRFQADDEPQVDLISLREVLEDDPILAPFLAIPSKENGIDLEGLAAQDKTLFVGFRGPVLRGNWVPVLITTFKEPDDYALRFVNLGGLGIRDLARVSDGLLVLAGPVGDGPGGFELYHWDGEDCLPASDQPAGELRHLGTVPRPGTAKAEGLAVLSESAESWQLLILYDGIAGGVPSRFEVSR